jgi:predicted O-linked N-acetylglucosamine transferase (SPINDLY family)
MAIVLPKPAAPASSDASDRRVRAHRQWLTGQERERRDDWRSAAAAYQQAADLCADAAYALAAIHALIKADCSADAVRSARRLREREPRTALAHTLESHALLSLGRPEDAVSCLRELPADVPRDHAHLVSLAVALQRSHRHQEAIRCFLDALAQKMDDALSHYRLGMSFKDIGMKAEAAECVRTAVVLGVGGSDLAARGQLAFYEREACRWPEAEQVLAELRPRVAAVPEGTPMEAAPFIHAVLSDDPAELLKVARHHALHVERGVVPLPRRSARGRAQRSVHERTRRLRIGYLSADFHQHATAQLMVQMLEAHDRSAFDVTLYSAGPDDGSPMRARLRSAVEHFEDLRGNSHAQMARRIRDAGVDILVDLKGATHDTLLPVLAHRCAPVQVHWLGFPGSSGARFIDYLVGDPYVTPLDAAAGFSEKIAQLPVCYQPNDSKRARPVRSGRAQWGVPQDKLLLCAFHQSYKISREVFDTWCELLHALPDACLWLLEWNRNVRDALSKAALERGIGLDRVIFSPVLPLDQHLARLAEADVYLDAWPCNAHTTASEALWVGVPVVTLHGRTFAQRVATSLLHAVQLPELSCTDVAGYRATVLSLATDAPRRAALREHLEAQAHTSPLFDGSRFARDIEALYQRMWELAAAGRPAEHLPAG